MMRVIVDVNHPAHVHLFKNFIWEMEKAGHTVLVTASQKDINFELLNFYKIPYKNLGSYGTTLLSKFINLFILDLKMLLVVAKFNPDVIVGMSTIRGAHAGFLLHKKVYIFTDTEHATEQIALYKPFATKLITPSCFLKDFGDKQIRYNGCHELAYLQKKYFKPNINVLKELGLKPFQKFFILRFVAWNATHDFGQTGISIKGKRKLIKILEKYGRVLITSEIELPEFFEKYKISVSPIKIHDLLAYASMYIGEGATMANEAVCLCTPSILVNPLKVGICEYFNKNGLMQIYKDERSLLENIESFVKSSIGKNYNKKCLEFINSKENVTDFMIKLISNAQYDF